MINTGAIVRYADYPQWGHGFVIRARKKTTEVFFHWGGRRKVAAGRAARRGATPTTVEADLFTLLARYSPQSWARGHHSLYAVELDPAVMKNRKFREKNPGGAASGCLYVGVTGLPPETRFERHLAGTQSARFVKAHGVRLRMDLVEGFSRLPFRVAAGDGAEAGGVAARAGIRRLAELSARARGCSRMAFAPETLTALVRGAARASGNDRAGRSHGV